MSVVPLLVERKDGAVVESLNMFASPYSLDGEQNLIRLDEDAFDVGDADEAPDMEDGDNGGKFQKGVACPAGWSDYQSAWMDKIPNEDNKNAEDHREIAFDINYKDDMSVATTGNMDATDAHKSVSLEILPSLKLP